MGKQYDWKSIGMLLAVFILFLGATFKGSEILIAIEMVLACTWVIPAIGTAAATIEVSHTLKYDRPNFTHNITFDQFKEAAEFVFIAFASPVTFAASLSLIRIAMSYWTKENSAYHDFFTVFEMSFISALGAYLVFASALKIWKHLLEVINTEKAEIPSPAKQPATELDQPPGDTNEV